LRKAANNYGNIATEKHTDMHIGATINILGIYMKYIFPDIFQDTLFFLLTMFYQMRFK
jgi:hypothetical protein